MSYLEELFSLRGRTCLVTGASRGIGRAVADAFFHAGATVYGIGRSDTISGNVGWRYLPCDVTCIDDVNRVLETIVDDGNQLSVLVNAAGITNPNSDETPRSVYRQTLETNLIAVYDICLAAYPYMKASGRGSIINITSIASVLGFSGNPGYVSSKGGLRMLTKALANDFCQQDIRVNNIAPGYIATDMTAVSFSDSQLHNERAERMLLGRWGEAKDLCGAAIFLASDASSYVTGSDLFVDGGWTAKGL
mgnify:CR=1 FL=1